MVYIDYHARKPHTELYRHTSIGAAGPAARHGIAAGCGLALAQPLVRRLRQHSISAARPLSPPLPAYDARASGSSDLLCAERLPDQQQYLSHACARPVELVKLCHSSPGPAMGGAAALPVADVVLGSPGHEDSWRSTAVRWRRSKPRNCGHRSTQWMGGTHCECSVPAGHCRTPICFEHTAVEPGIRGLVLSAISVGMD